jgi:uncharacterized membrane protein YidH (DUF202 family)
VNLQIASRHRQCRGTQPERTSLSWQRSCLALVGLALVMMRLQQHSRTVTATALAALLLGAAAGWCSRHGSGSRMAFPLAGRGLANTLLATAVLLLAAAALACGRG